MTFISTATCVTLVGATPIFADIEEDYWCICPDDVEAKITDKTKAVIGVHLFGQPFSKRIREICDNHGLALIEDAAQAHGAILDGKMAGFHWRCCMLFLLSFKKYGSRWRRRNDLYNTPRTR